MTDSGEDHPTDDGVLVVVIDHPPVNAIATPVRRRLFDALQRAIRDADVRAVVITGRGKLFSAGADLGEFAAGTALEAPSLHADILPLVAAMRKPVVAAVHGAALGGGLELALGCHDRVFAEGTRVGLPETTLGLMPGAGGTQWLPRAVGLARAADLIVRGRVEAIEALAGTALAHAIVPAPRVVEVAIRRAKALHAGDRAIGDRLVADADGLRRVREMAASLRARPDTLPGQLCALDAIALAASLDVAAGMRAEFALFEPLLASAESRALRHVFLAERRHRPDAESERFAPAFAERVRARLDRERAALVAAGADADAVARAAARWRSPAVAPTTDDPALADRLLGAVVDEGRCALAAGEVASEDDVDLALVRTGDFARVHGGAFFQARLRGVEARPERTTAG